MKKYFILLILFTLSKSLYAGWPINTGRYIIAPTFTYYTAGDYWDNNGKLVHVPKGAGFTSKTFSIYCGFGISHKVDIIVNLPTSIQTSSFGGNSTTTLGFNDLQLGINYNIINFGFTGFLSVQLTGIVPLYKNQPQAYRGYQSTGADIKLSYTKGFTSFITKTGFFNVETGYRDYFNTDGPQQINYSASLGLAFNRKNQVIIEVGGVYSNSTNKAFSINETANHDFRYTKTALTYLHSVSKHFSIGAGGFYTLMGRNTGLGRGASAQTLFKF